jgi:GNAT superfamily N-acetyltransferase
MTKSSILWESFIGLLSLIARRYRNSIRAIGGWPCTRPSRSVFAGVIPSTRADNAGYFSRVGVLRKHCGHGLQLRMMRAIEARARAYGWSCVVSDTTDNIASANNFIRAGYRLYQPQHPWAWPNTLYWRKSIK